MKMLLPVVILSATLLAFADESQGEDSEYGSHVEWRKAMCDKNDREMFKEMDACFKMESKVVIDATEECSKEIHPESDGKLVDFVTAACEDKTLFRKFDDCFEEYEANSAFREQMEITPDVEACYQAIIEKYDMDSLKNYLKESVTES